MMMTELEIVSTFRQAKYPGKQVAILAELNDCTTEKIKEILLRNGVDQKNLPRKSRKMRQMEMDALVESSANEDTAEIRAANPVSAEIPASTEVPAQDETILDLIRREEAAVNAEHGSLSEQIVSLRTAQKTAERRLADIRTARRALERYFGLDVEPEENPDFYCSEGERSEVND